jgi:hypothetical protein
MCANYWTLKVIMPCPKCGKKNNFEFQTHFMGGGDGGHCDNYYELHQEVIPLKGMTMTMNRDSDWFIDRCPYCETWFDMGADVENGRIRRVFAL